MYLAQSSVETAPVATDANMSPLSPARSMEDLGWLHGGEEIVSLVHARCGLAAMGGGVATDLRARVWSSGHGW